MVDLSLKPTLANYPFRVQPDERPCVRPIHRAEDGDDALLAMIDQQAELASKKMKIGCVKQGVQILHSAYRMVESYVESFPSGDPMPPAAVLGAGTVRLALCVALSSTGRHKQALDEAKMAARELDKVWRSLFLASAEQEEATADGDKHRPSPPLRDALRNPPQWLERAVVAAVQARHCIALELEFEAKSMRSGVSQEVPRDLPAKADEDDVGREDIPDPVPASEAFTVQEQVGRLHREGVQLARQLLPENHAVRHRAELALDEWLQRTGGDGQPNLAPSPVPVMRPASRRKTLGKLSGSLAGISPRSSPLGMSPLLSTQSLSPTCAPAFGSSDSAQLSESALPAILRLGARKRLPPVTPAAMMSMQTATTSTGSATSVGFTLGSDSVMSRLRLDSDSVMSSLPTRGEAPQSAKKRGPRPPSEDKDKLRVPTPESHEAPSRQGSKQSRSSDRRESITQPRIRQTKSAQQKAKEAAIALAQKDPFEDWRRNMVNEAQMSPFQRQLKSDAGLEKLQGHLKNEARMFKNFWIKEIDPDHLFDNRLKFGPAGMKIQENAKKELEKFKKDNWAVTEEGKLKNSTRKELFQYFGSKVTEEQPKLSDLAKLLTKSQTHGANLDKQAKEEEKRQLALKRSQSAKALCVDFGLKEQFRKSASNAGQSPSGHFHKTLSTMTFGGDLRR